MATSKKPKGNPTRSRAPRVDAGAREGVRRLPPNFQALAQGERPPRRQRPPVLYDDRDHGLIAGVGNRQARAAYELRLSPLLDAATEADRRCQLLAEVQLLGLWRAKQLTGFDAFAEDVLDASPAEAREAARSGAEAMGLSESDLPDLTIAMWIRSESALTGACPGARVSAVAEGSDINLILCLPTKVPARAIDGLAALGSAMTGLARLLEGADSKPPSGRPRKERG